MFAHFLGLALKGLGKVKRTNWVQICMILDGKFGSDSLSKFCLFKQKVSLLYEEVNEIENSSFVPCYPTWLKNGIYFVTNFAAEILKTDSRVGWPNIFLKMLTIQFPLSFNLYFQQKRAPNLSICYVPTKRSVSVFDVTNRTNGVSNFQSYHQVMYLFNSLAKSCTLFWKFF